MRLSDIDFMNSEKQPNFSEFQYKPWKFILFVAKQRKWIAIVAIIFTICSVTLNSGIFLFVRNITNAFSNPASDPEKIYELLGFFLAVMVVRNILSRSSGILIAKWVTYAELFSAQVAFDYLSLHSSKYFANNLSGKLQSKVFNISSSINRIFPMFVWNFLGLFVKLTVSISMAFWVNSTVGLTFLGFVLASIMFSATVSKKIAVYAREHSDSASEARGVIVDVIGNILAVKQNTAIEREMENVSRFLENNRKTHYRVWKYVDSVLLCGNFLLVVMIGTTLYFTVSFWQSGMVSSGDVVMIFTMFLTLFMDLEHFSMTLNNFMQELGQLKEGLEGIFATYDITDSKNYKKVEIKDGKIIFDDVSFHYEEDEKKSVFDNLSLIIPKGQKIGLVGESGAGKSTFVSLLLRFMDIEDGKILVDGYDIKEMRQDDLRRAIAYVPQEALLFHRTLEENIKYSNPEATHEEMVEASKNAHALGFIEKLPKGFDTLVGERGVKLSGGQRQRVMIARAMLKKSPILVLDEATSALDSQSEKFIQDALDDLMKNRTTIVIAHRLSTLKKMDRIIVFDGGKIIEDGSHSELIMKKGKYYDLWTHQAGGMM